MEDERRHGAAPGLEDRAISEPWRSVREPEPSTTGAATTSRDSRGVVELRMLNPFWARSLRVISLAACDLIACEDTRRTAKLLSACGISRPTLGLHKFSERDRIDEVLAALRRGEDVALVSAGGTPGSSGMSRLVKPERRPALHQPTTCPPR